MDPPVDLLLPRGPILAKFQPRGAYKNDAYENKVCKDDNILCDWIKKLKMSLYNKIKNLEMMCSCIDITFDIDILF